jgi:hypothetical protein
LRIGPVQRDQIMQVDQTGRPPPGFGRATAPGRRGSPPWLALT